MLHHLYNDAFDDLFDDSYFEPFCRKYMPDVRRYNLERSIKSAESEECPPFHATRGYFGRYSSDGIMSDEPNHQLMRDQYMKVMMLEFLHGTDEDAIAIKNDDLEFKNVYLEFRPKNYTEGPLWTIHKSLIELFMPGTYRPLPVVIFTKAMKAYFTAVSTVYRLLFIDHTFVNGNIKDPYTVIMRELSDDDKKRFPALPNIIRGFLQILEGGNLLDEKRITVSIQDLMPN